MNFLLDIIIKILSPFIFILIYQIIAILILILYNSKKYDLKIKKSKSEYKKESILKRLFIKFPSRLAKDILNRNPNHFREYGLHLFCGEQGAGKTISVVEMLQRMKKIYPDCKIRTNMNYKYQDGEIRHWKDLIKNENGEYGQIEVLDEIQTWFSSLQSKDFPPEMLTEISQQRKQRKMIVGTAQVFSRVAKPIREQTLFVYLPITIFGCLTIVRKTKPEFWDDDKMKFKRYLGTYFFVHTDEIRNAFDTYEKIESYKKQGFYNPEWKIAK